MPPAREIGLDGRNLFPSGGGTGVSTYVSTLADAQRALGNRPRWLLAAPPGRAAPDGSRGRRFVRALAPWRGAASLPFGSAGPDAAWLAPDLFRTAQVHFNLYRRPLRVRPDVHPALMHWSYPLPLVMTGVPQLLTIHDLIPLEAPSLSGIRAERHDRMLRALLPRMDAVVTVSETVRQAVLRRYGLAPGRVVNTGQPVDLPPSLLREADRLPESPVPPDGFVALGTVERRKNIGRIIRAHAASGTTRPLSIIGPDGDGAAAEMAVLADHPHPQRVHRLPWLARASLVRALREARALLFPSLAEGFGLPIAEAMTLGTPVLTSLGGATAEIAGDAALLVDPRDVGSIAHAVASLDRDHDRHAALRSAGLARAAVFAPDAYAARIGVLYRSVLESRRGSLPAENRIT